ncbi:MAG: right-handed parallel beta-helix repeat-containing protein, partial [Planctomycetes bacterium]|nr:right-handed parallel beta-helix repeat-containing protein [Planctomycetota bacterium]
LTLRGLSFQHADWQHDKTKVADGQAAVHLTAAVVATGARHCAVENCEIAHVGEYALILGEGCKHNRVFHCHIHDLGAGGVRIGETVLHREPERQTDHNVVDNCFIHDGGHVFRAGIGVWIGRSSFNTVSHNEICDFYYSGCSVGWSWGYAATSANHNVFEYNHIHNIGKGVLSDMGGIYSLGVSPGTVERFNLIHDVYSYSYGGWGLYTDEGSSDIVLENNLVYRTKSGGFHQHYGQNNIIRNNIFAFAWEDNVKSGRSDVPNSFTFERNMVLTDNGWPIGGRLDKENFTLRNNLYWDVAGADLEFAGHDFAEWQALGKDQGSLIADPLFAAPATPEIRRSPSPTDKRPPTDGILKALSSVGVPLSVGESATDRRPPTDGVLNALSSVGVPLSVGESSFRPFVLQEGSPALKLGFQPFDVSTAGLYGEPEWVNAPKQIVRKPDDVPPARPRPQPQPISDDFESTAVGDPPKLATVSGEDKGASIRVTDEMAASGQRSLKFTDAPGLAHDWQPHLVYRPLFKRGTARL